MSAWRRASDVIPLREATRAWFSISLQTFGGPAGQIAIMQHKLVDEKRWIGQQRFLHALNYCMLLPGPEAQQLAIYTGWLLNGTRGGLIAGGLFVLPGMLALLVLSAVYVAFGETGFVTAVFAGVAPAVIAIVVQAVARVGRRALISRRPRRPRRGVLRRAHRAGRAVPGGDPRGRRARLAAGTRVAAPGRRCTPRGDRRPRAPRQ